MPPDAARVAEASAWLARAAEDMRAAAFGLTAAPPLTAHVAFDCQQAVEKSLKALLVWHGRTFRKTHSLIEIGEPCAALEPVLEPLLRRAARLSEYAWRFRYPGDAPLPTTEEATLALSIAQEVFKAVVAKVPFDARV